MKAGKLAVFGVLSIMILSHLSWSQEAGQLDELVTLFDSTAIVEAHVFAPKAYEKAREKFDKAEEAIEKGWRQKRVDELIGESREYIENALKATEVARLALGEYLEPRRKAREYRAFELVPELYLEAEEQFIKATQKIEEGNVRDGLKEAEKSSPLFDVAELEAIRKDVMGEAAALIEKAETDEAKKFALATFDKAQTAYTRCNNILSSDRYNRQEALEAIRTAEYEARHASNIAQMVRSLERNDQAWEKLMLFYEIEMQKVGDLLDRERLPFDKGPGVAADTIISAVREKLAEKRELERVQQEMVQKLEETLTRLGEESPPDDPVELAGEVHEVVDRTVTDKAELADRLERKEDKLVQLEETSEEIASELEIRRQKEEKIKQIRKLLKPIEGEVLLNATSDIVIRLYGLSFASGSSEIVEKHVPLLEKVESIIEMFPGSNLVVEGHTDDRGSRNTNMRLSEKRAVAVTEYLRRSMSLSSDRIDSYGYGPDKPIGTNTTPEGRAKNRRIDIIILQ